MEFNPKSFVFLILPLLFIALFMDISLAHKKEGTEIRSVFKTFQQGVDSLDKSVPSKITTEKFQAGFASLYNMLIEAYAQAKIPFPMEIGHIKILSDGRAKVETYINPAKNRFVFTLEKNDGVWKLCHSEGILLPIYSIPEMPYKDIYQIQKDKRGWMMAERDLAFQSRVYEKIRNLEGAQAAKDFFLDGPGYCAAMNAWLPFVEGAAQFALFFAIIQKNYYGANYLITDATMEQAEIHCNPLMELNMLQRSSFSPKFTQEQFKELFEHIMKQRAEYCGLEISFTYYGLMCVIRLKKIR